ncbi:hypothetical protein J6500_28945 [Bradyrhizobium sp. WSM 1704]|uniref:hypothetical protein n=1 Tax=Bradyrhizobium semiaridum TaxID=2821404 RepID=UPI001CE37861|nr:hypothetical protein [Bradyrhizobium semiaridum]MCA6125891.1 hypothetical protein [Bradyrhizobium semiaridum]
MGTGDARRGTKVTNGFRICCSQEQPPKMSSCGVLPSEHVKALQGGGGLRVSQMHPTQPPATGCHEQNQFCGAQAFGFGHVQPLLPENGAAPSREVGLTKFIGPRGIRESQQADHHREQNRRNRTYTHEYISLLKSWSDCIAV